MELKSDMRSLIISVAYSYYSRSLAQVVYTLLVHIDSTKRLEDSFVIVHTTKKL